MSDEKIPAEFEAWHSNTFPNQNPDGLFGFLRFQGWQASRTAQSEAKPDPLRDAVESMVGMMENGEWAEHAATFKAPGDKLASRLEACITDLHNEAAESIDEDAPALSEAKHCVNCGATVDPRCGCNAGREAAQSEAKPGVAAEPWGICPDYIRRLAEHADTVSIAMRKAWTMGKNYWRLADSERTSDHRKSDDLQKEFDGLIEGTRNLVLSASWSASPSTAPIGAGDAESVHGLTKKGDMRVIDGCTWVCADPDIDRWVSSAGLVCGEHNTRVIADYVRALLAKRGGA